MPATRCKKVGTGRRRGLSTDVFLHFPPTNHSIESRTLQSVFPPSGVKIGPIFLTESWSEERVGAFFINEWISIGNWWGVVMFGHPGGATKVTRTLKIRQMSLLRPCFNCRPRLVQIGKREGKRQLVKESKSHIQSQCP